MKDEAFLFERYGYDRASGTLSLFYAFKGGDRFEERVVFPPCPRALSAAEEAALDRAFRLVFLLSGVSYYKAYAPPVLRCEAFPMDAAMAAFLEKVYLNGLGEFAFRNHLSLKLHFEAASGAAREAAPRLSWPSPSRVLVPVGGGKDSIVTLEALRRAGEDVTLFALGSHSGVAGPIVETIRQAGLPSLTVTRTLSQNLFALNKAGALNGHVPITAILSSLAVATAILHGFNAVALSNEHSANAPNLMVGDFAVNHQYSKSLAFEADFAAIVRSHVAADLDYFSFLRPLLETEIARRFASLEAYHPVFRSCNAAFRQDKERRGANWCGDCPKCRFVFLALAPFIAREKLAEIFGKNLLDDPAQIEGFRELCGLGLHKPFECVGEVEESAALMKKLSGTPAWAQDAVVKALGPSLPSGSFEALLRARHEHRMPPRFREILDA